MNNQTIDVRGMEEVQQFIKALGTQGTDIIVDESYRITIDIRNDIVKSMRNTKKEARITKFGYTRKGQPKNKVHFVSSSGFPPAIQTGNLANRIIPYKGEGYAMCYVDNVKYAKWLEEGTKKMEARPFFAPAVERSNYEKRIINRIIAERFAGRGVSE